MNWKEIIEGWRNKILPPEHLKEMIQKTSEERLGICARCSHNSKFHNFRFRKDEHCVKCGCTLSAKTSCMSCKCPVDKWHSVITDEEELEIERHEQKNSSDRKGSS